MADDQKTGQQIDILRYEAKTLRSELDQRKKLPVAECVRLGLWLTSALGYLHKQNVIHRDIKPSNIVFIGGVPKLADLGLATELRPDISLVGTPKYMPPESQWTPQGDLYSLGLVLFEASTGKDPLSVSSSSLDLIGDENEETQRGWAGIIFRACERDPQKRYQSADEMHEALQLLQRSQGAFSV